MTDEQFVDKFMDLVLEYTNTKDDTIIYGETVETQKGIFDIEVKIICYNNYLDCDN
jgi:hypothetical protein